MRYLPTTPNDRQDMLTAIGVSSIDALYDDVPASARLTELISGQRRIGG
jgi:glycine dehydrogenase subunit 1